MKILFILLVLNFNIYGEDIFSNSEIDEISSIIEGIKEEIPFENKTNQNSKIDKIKTEEKSSSISKLKARDAFLSTDFINNSGEAGSWLLNILYETHDYKSGPRKHGLSVEYSWVFDLKYFVFHAISNFSYYNGYYDKKGFIPLGLGAEVLLGLPSYMFISCHYVFEYAKQEGGDFLNFTRYGLGMYFNLSNINKKSQFQMYKNHGIRRTYLIVKYNIRNTTNLIDYYSKNSIAAGLGFEY